MSKKVSQSSKVIPFLNEGDVDVVAPRPVYMQTILTDKDGQVIVDNLKYVKSLNGSGFVISYTEKMSDFIVSCKVASVVRVFVYLAHHQNYAADGETYGYRCSHKYLQTLLGLDRSTLWDALKYLKSKYLVHVAKINGQYEFMVNPNYVTIGRDKASRIVEWNKRWAETLRQQDSISR